MPYIQNISTLPGQHVFSHEQMAEWLFLFSSTSSFSAKYLDLAQEGSIAHKRTFLPNFEEALSAPSPISTKERMEAYQNIVPAIGGQVSQQCLQKAEVDTDQITDIIAISCTGVMAPGLETVIAEHLRLKSQVNRYAINFMGCYASLHGWRLARLIALQNPKARILMVAVEWSALHFNPDYSTHNLLGTYLFNDGAAACLISGSDIPPTGPAVQIKSFHSKLFSQGKGEMKWTIGDQGFELTLSSRVPVYIKQHLKQTIQEVLVHTELQSSKVHHAVHPGGKNILKAFELALNLPPDRLSPSWNVLSQYGNMSSATVLFVLHEMLARPEKYQGSVLASAFGPGLTIEMAHLEIV
jgi:predicted naringenin-chalcone synthase